MVRGSRRDDGPRPLPVAPGQPAPATMPVSGVARAPLPGFAAALDILPCTREEKSRSIALTDSAKDRVRGAKSARSIVEGEFGDTMSNLQGYLLLLCQ